MLREARAHRSWRPPGLTGARPHASRHAPARPPPPQGLASLRPYVEPLVAGLFRLLRDSDPAVSGHAAGALVNVSGDPTVMKELLKENVCGRCMEHVRGLTCPHHDMLVMLLANVTLEEEGCMQLLQADDERLQGLNVAVLLKLFVDTAEAASKVPEFGAPAGGVQAPDLYEHVASVLCNITSVKKTRKVVLERGRGLLNALLPQLRSRSETRRRGTAAAFKNCCMTAEEDGTLDQIVEDKDILSAFLAPIGGGDGASSDAKVRENLAEAVEALAGTKKGRDALAELRAHDVLRKGYETEEDPAVCGSMERASDLLLKHEGIGKEFMEYASNQMVGGS